MPGGGWTSNTINSAYYNGNTYIGYIDANGNVGVAKYNHASRSVSVSPVIVGDVAIDYHSMPSVLVRSSDHKIVIAVAQHGGDIFVAVSTNAEDVSSWGAAIDITATIGATLCTYANLFQLSGESGKVYLFYRDQPGGAGTTAILSFSTSTDGGSSWSHQTQLYENSGKTTYWAISSDSSSRIDFIASDGAAENGDTASLYHFYYRSGQFFKSDGTAISPSPPLSPSNLTKIFDGAIQGNVRAPVSVITSGGGPYATWAAYNTAGAGSNENYWYGVYSSSWTVNKVDDSGTVPEIPGIIEGDLCLDRTDPTTVFASRKVSGRWQMFVYRTTNSGASWTNTQLTFDTTDGGDIHPVSPRDAVSSLSVLWLSGTYGPAGVPFSFQIRGYPKH